MIFTLDDYSAYGGHMGNNGDGYSGMEEFRSETFFSIMDAHGWGDGDGDGEGDG